MSMCSSGWAVRVHEHRHCGLLALRLKFTQMIQARRLTAAPGSWPRYSGWCCALAAAPRWSASARADNAGTSRCRCRLRAQGTRRRLADRKYFFGRRRTPPVAADRKFKPNLRIADRIGFGRQEARTARPEVVGVGHCVRRVAVGFYRRLRGSLAASIASGALVTA